MFMKRHQRSTNAALRCNHHDICGGRKRKGPQTDFVYLLTDDGTGQLAMTATRCGTPLTASQSGGNRAAMRLPDTHLVRPLPWFAQVGLYHTGRPFLSRS